MKQTEKTSQIDQAEPLIRRSTDKINQNLTHSRQRIAQSAPLVPDQLYLQASADNYHHIVQVENGDKLHYYRHYFGEDKAPAVKVEETKREEDKYQLSEEALPIHHQQVTTVSRPEAILW